MYLLNVKPLVSKEKLAEVVDPHKEWVKQGFEKGWFIFAGPKTEKGGGLILVRSVPKSELEAFIAIDPYVTKNVAQYELIEFNMAVTEDGLEQR